MEALSRISVSLSPLALEDAVTGALVLRSQPPLEERAVTWTLACGSARLLVDLVAGRDPGLDSAPYRFEDRAGSALPSVVFRAGLRGIQ